MTKGELVKLLEQYPDSMEILVWDTETEMGWTDKPSIQKGNDTDGNEVVYIG